MKANTLILSLFWLGAPIVSPQEAKVEKVSSEQIPQMLQDYQYILVPSKLAEFTEPYLSFMLISGDRFVYQTQGSNENPGERRINKTVIGRITSHELESSANRKITRIKLQVETDAGVSFAAGFTVKPSGEATCWISRNHNSSKKHLSGWLSSPHETSYEVGPVSTDLALFPWDQEKTTSSWYEYLLGFKPYQYDHEYLPSGGRMD